MKIKIAAALAVLFGMISPSFAETSPQVKNYTSIVYANYRDSLEGAKTLQTAINAFLDNPSDEKLTAAKQAWIKARLPYSQTEVYRFYEGPIDFTNKETGEDGPEARINAWPLNEAYIDYVDGNPAAGIIQNAAEPVTVAALTEKNQQKDEADVATGYHAIEFLLWGQDLDARGTGARPFTDYSRGDKIKERRRQYLKNVTQLLVDDLQKLVAAWEPGKNNYAKNFMALPPEEVLGKILTGAASLAGSEMASERINNALISGDQEDEQSCFSDTTKNDFAYNLKGIANVYLGEYGSSHGPSISELVAARKAGLDKSIKGQLKLVDDLIEKIDLPHDQVLASPKDSEGRKKLQEVVQSLHVLADLLKQAGDAIGVHAEIVSE